MTATTLGDVQIAIRKSDRSSAIQLLKAVLQESPSADAWYLAAKLTRDKQKAMKYLRRALLIDPHHRSSLILIKQLGGSRRSFLSYLKEELIDFAHDQCDRSPLLKRLSPSAQLIAAILVTILTTAAFILTMATLLAPTGPVISETPPPPAPVSIISARDVVTQFNARGGKFGGLELLNYQAIESGYTLKVGLRDSNNTQYLADIVIFTSISTFMDHQDLLEKYELTSNVIASRNAMLAYPIDLDAGIAQRLVNAFSSIVGS